jgi:hypothetical protein
MKKLTTMLLVLTMLLSSAGAFAEAGEHVSFTVCTTSTNEPLDYTSDGLYKYLGEKFNFDFEVWPVAGESQDEKLRIWVNSFTMPTTMSWYTFNYFEYIDYIDQGLLAPLPEGWEEKYPNMRAMMEKTGLMEYITVNDEVYCVPHATFHLFMNFEPVINHGSIFYRKDWVEKLGLEPFGALITESQFKEYLKLAIENDLAGTGNTLGLSAAPANVNNMLMAFAGVNYNGYHADEEGFSWGPTEEGIIEAIQNARTWYQDGLLNPDYYLHTNAEASSLFTSGIAAATYDSGVVGGLATKSITFESATGLSADESIGLTALKGDDGIFYGYETTNYWSASVFNPSIDEVTMDRILSLIDFSCTKEGQYIIQLGVPDVDWKFNDEGKAELLIELKEDGTYPTMYEMHPSYRVFRMQGILADDFNFANPRMNQNHIDMVTAIYTAKAAQGNVIIPYSYDYAFFSSDNKANYSVGISGEITKLIISTDDIAAAWNQFIEEYRNMWEPLLDELNAAYYPK